MLLSLSVCSTNGTKWGIRSVLSDIRVTRSILKNQQVYEGRSHKTMRQTESCSLMEGWEFNLFSSSERELRDDLIDSR